MERNMGFKVELIGFKKSRNRPLFHLNFCSIQQVHGLISFAVTGKANVVFCDGHVESPTLPFLFTDTSDAALSRWNRDHQPHRERLAP
jgi:prepilin-type processing-associated H-X9-DG protein